MLIVDKKDFSGGMMSSVNPKVAPSNTFERLKNVDIWTKEGSIVLWKELSSTVNFPSGKSYDHHVMFPAHGDTDYAIVMVTDGNIYSFDGSTFTSIGSVTAGSRMAYAGDRIYVHYRHPTAPTAVNHLKKVIEYDYSAGTFSISEGTVEDEMTIDDGYPVVLSTDFTTENDDHYYKVRLTSVRADGAESYGVQVNGQLVNGDDSYMRISRDGTNAYRGRIYMAIRHEDTNEFLEEAFFCELQDGSNNSYIPITTGKFFVSAGGTLTVEKISSGSNVQSFFSYLVEEHVENAVDFIDTGHKIRYAGVEYEIDSMARNSGWAGGTAELWDIETTPNLPPDMDSDMDDSLAEPRQVFLELEVSWVANDILVPIGRHSKFYLTTPLSENRPESKKLDGAGDFIAVASNFLFATNPYFPEYYEDNEPLDKKGFIAWSFITGEGQKAFSLIPDTNLIAPPMSGSAITGLFTFQDDLILTQRHGLTRIVVESTIPLPVQSEPFGIEDDREIYISGSKFFIYSNTFLYEFQVDRRRSNRGTLVWREIGSSIREDLSAFTDVGMFHDTTNDLLYVWSRPESKGFICSLREERPRWVEWSDDTIGAASYDLYSGFMLDGDPYFVLYDDIGGNYEIGKYHASNLLNSNIIIQDHLKISNFSDQIVAKAEVTYKKTSGALTFKIFINGTEIHSDNLDNKTSLGTYEVLIDQSLVSRYDTIYWQLTGDTLVGFELEYVGVNAEIENTEHEDTY